VNDKLVGWSLIDEKGKFSKIYSHIKRIVKIDAMCE